MVCIEKTLCEEHDGFLNPFNGISPAIIQANKSIGWTI